MAVVGQIRSSTNATTTTSSAAAAPAADGSTNQLWREEIEEVEVEVEEEEDDDDDDEKEDDEDDDEEEEDEETTSPPPPPSSDCAQHTRRGSFPGQQSRLQYVHIPKAGGSTIQQALYEWTRKAKLRTFIHDGGDLTYNCPKRVSAARGLTLVGHRGFGFCRALDQAHAKMTFAVALREPVSRMRSLFDYIMASKHAPFAVYHAAWRNKSFSDLVMRAAEAERNPAAYAENSLEQFTFFRFHEFAHQQTNFLCGWACVARAVRNSTSPEALDSNLEAALVNLRRCDVVAVMEKLDDMIVQFAYQAPHLVPASVKRFPVDNKHSGKKSQITDEAREVLARWSARDTVLYDAALVRHHQLTAQAKQCV